MLIIMPGMTRNSVTGIDKLVFDRYDKNGDGVINYAEYNHFIAENNVNKINKSKNKKNKKYDIEQFDPKGTINLERNGGHNSIKLNFLA